MNIVIIIVRIQMKESNLGVFRCKTRVAVVDRLPNWNRFLADRLHRLETLNRVHWHLSSHLISLFSLGQLSQSLNLSLMIFDLSLHLLVLSLRLGLLP